MTRRTGSGPAGRSGVVAALAAAALAAPMLLPPAPAEAGWLGRGLGVAGAARSLKRNLGEAVDLLDDTLGAAIQGDFKEVERLSGELKEVPGRIITDAFPVLGIGAAALKGADAAGEGLKAARRRVGRFVGEAITDARMALESGEYETEAGVLDPKRPLPAVTLSGPAGTKRPVPAGSGAASAPDPWGQDPEEDEETATGKPDPWGQAPEEEETAAGGPAPPGEDDQAGREGGDVATDRLQGEYAAALNRFLGAEEGSSDYEATLSALLEREQELLAGVAGQEERELTPDERQRGRATLAAQGTNPGTADGVFGPRTQAALRAGQRSKEYAATGALTDSRAQEPLGVQPRMAREPEPEPEAGQAPPVGGGEHYAAADDDVQSDDEIAGVRGSGDEAERRQAQPTRAAPQSGSEPDASMVGPSCENAQRQAKTAIEQIDRRAKSAPRGGSEDICAQINRFDVVIRTHQECIRDLSFSEAEKSAMRTQLLHLEGSRFRLKKTFDGVAAWVSCECWTSMC